MLFITPKTRFALETNIMISPPWPFFSPSFQIKRDFRALYQIKWLVKLDGLICLWCRGIFLLMAYCRLNGDTKGRNGGVTSEAVTQSESHVPQRPCPAQPQIPERLQPLDSLVCRQTAGSTFHLVSFLENSFILFSAHCPMLAQDQHIHAIASTRRNMCMSANTQVEV